MTESFDDLTDTEFQTSIAEFPAFHPPNSSALFTNEGTVHGSTNFIASPTTLFETNTPFQLT